MEYSGTSKLAKKLASVRIYFQLVIIFFISLGGLYGIQEILDHFKIDLLNKITNSFVVFLLISLVFSLLRYIIFLFGIIHEKENINTQKEPSEDSIIEMLKHAQAHQRWTEIIKIGSALSEVLWFTSRKKVRVEIGRIIEVAATQVNDSKVLATTLIEDIGNTELGLGDPTSGIKHIKQGIQIAEENNYDFLVVRGYRNLACCYAFKDDVANCNSALIKAYNVANAISDESQKLEALGATAYAKSKLFKHKGNYTDAIKALDESIDYYEQLGQLHPETQNKNKDRLVKVYREKGIIYLSDNNVEEAKKSLFTGLRMAEETSNYENIVRCCVLLSEIMIENDELSAVDGMLQIAKEYIDKIDTESVKKDFEKISTEYLVRKSVARS